MTDAADHAGKTTPVAEAEAQPVTAEAIAETIAEFEQYRERLVNETMTAAKKAKMSKKETMNRLESELQKIDNILDNLRAQYETMTTAN